MAKKPLPTPEELRQLLTYDPETGVLTWIKRPVTMFREGNTSSDAVCRAWNKNYAGKPAFIANSHGYRTGSVFGQRLLAHRVAWAMFHGRWPVAHLDHINGDPSDNRIANLREATNAENMQNLTVHPRNTTGYPGVTFCKTTGRFKAQIRNNMRREYLGLFETAEEAGAAYVEAKRRLHTFNPYVRRMA